MSPAYMSTTPLRNPGPPASPMGLFGFGLGPAHASPFLALAAYSSSGSTAAGTHAHRRPTAHFHLAHDEPPVPPSIMRRRSSAASAASASSSSTSSIASASAPPVPSRRASSTPSLCHSSSSSLASMRSPASPYTPVLSGVDEDAAAAVVLAAADDDDDDDIFSALDNEVLPGDAKNRLLFAPSPAKPTPPTTTPRTQSAPARAASTRPALVRRDTPIPPRSSVPADGRRLPRPSQAFVSSLRTEPDLARYAFAPKAAETSHSAPAPAARPQLKRRDTPRPAFPSASAPLGMAPLRLPRKRTPSANANDDARAVPSPTAWLETLSSELVRAWRASPAPVFDEGDDGDDAEPLFRSVFENDSDSGEEEEEGEEDDDDDDDEQLSAAHDHLERWRHGVARAESGRPQSWTSVRTGQVWVAV